jgi:acyl dehydratase
MSKSEVLARLEAQVGAEVYLGDWLEVTQARVDQFAQATEDFQWIHVDPARAASESPWRGTIAHGFLTLSLLPRLRPADHGQAAYPGVKSVINYGLNRVRFTNVVRVGSRIRARCMLLSTEGIPGGVQMIERHVVEIDGERKPACTAEVVVRLFF